MPATKYHVYPYGKCDTEGPVFTTDGSRVYSCADQPELEIDLNLRHRRRICTSMLRSTSSSCRWVAASNCSRLSNCCGDLRDAVSRLNSPTVSSTEIPVGDVRRRVRRFSSPC